jgi:nitroreductase
MSTISRQDLLQQLHWRYATKQFDPTRKIGAEDWATLEQALLLTASSTGLQPWKFIVVKDPAVRKRLQPAARGQTQVVDASHLVVFAAKLDIGEADVDAHLRRTAAVRGMPVEALAGYRGMVVGGIVKGMDTAARNAWSRNQTYIALGNLLTSAALLGIDACPMEGFDHAQFDEILGLKARGLASTAMATLGYRAATDKYAALPKVRFPLEDVIVNV